MCGSDQCVEPRDAGLGGVMTSALTSLPALFGKRSPSAVSSCRLFRACAFRFRYPSFPSGLLLLLLLVQHQMHIHHGPAYAQLPHYSTLSHFLLLFSTFIARIPPTRIASHPVTPTIPILPDKLTFLCHLDASRYSLILYAFALNSRLLFISCICSVQQTTPIPPASYHILVSRTSLLLCHGIFFTVLYSS